MEKDVESVSVTGAHMMIMGWKRSRGRKQFDNMRTAERETDDRLAIHVPAR